MTGYSEVAGAADADRQRDAWLVRTLEHAATGVAIWGLDGRIVEANYAFYSALGHTRATIDARSIFDLMHASDLAELKPRVDRLLASESEPFTAEHRFLHSSGSHVWMRSSLAAARAGKGGTARLVSLSEDLTARKRAEQTVRDNEAMALVGRLSASIAHEINNPLESIVNLHYLALHTENLEQVRRYVEMAETETARVSRIALQTLRFHRKTAQPSTCRPGELVQTVLELFRHKLARSRIEVRMEQEDVPTFRCMDGEMRQVLANLVGNALDAMRGGGILHVRVRPATDWRTGEGNAVRITIADTGSGIQPEARRRMYEPFFTTKGAVGSGIGLWLSSEIIARHGGAIHVRSSTESGRSGTAFTLLLPGNGPAASAQPAD